MSRWPDRNGDPISRKMCVQKCIYDKDNVAKVMCYYRVLSKKSINTGQTYCYLVTNADVLKLLTLREP